MQKAILILLVGLLWCGNAYAKSIFDYIKIGDSKNKVKGYVYAFGGMQGKWKKTDEMLRTSLPDAPAICSWAWDKPPAEYRINKYFPKYLTEITTHFTGRPVQAVKGAPWYVFENVTKPIKLGGGFCWEGNGKLKAVVFSREEALAIADPTYLARKKEEEDKRALVQNMMCLQLFSFFS